MTLRRSPIRRTAPLLRRAELRSKSRPRSRAASPEQRVTPEIREQVFARDEYRCVAPLLAARHGAPIDACRDRWGRPAVAYITADGPVYRREALTYEHVRLVAAMGGRKPHPSLRMAVTACWHHNTDGWCQANKRWERNYLAEIYGGIDDPE